MNETVEFMESSLDPISQPVDRCWFCAEVCPEGESICHRDKCHWHYRELYQDLHTEEMKKRKGAILASMRHRVPEDWPLPEFITESRYCDSKFIRQIFRWFYAVKCAFCIILRLEPREHQGRSDVIETGYWNAGVDYFGEAYGDSIRVGRGVLENWFYQIGSI